MSHAAHRSVISCLSRISRLSGRTATCREGRCGWNGAVVVADYWFLTPLCHICRFFCKKWRIYYKNYIKIEPILY